MMGREEYGKDQKGNGSSINYDEMMGFSNLFRREWTIYILILNTYV